jgi:putative phosphoesterase
VKIAILSDTHSQEETVRRALKLVEGSGAGLILHCGDIEDPDTARLFPAGTHFVLGNCDGEPDGLRRAIREAGGTLHEPFGHLDLPGAKIAFLHGDDTGLLRDLEQSGQFDYIFHGHTHVAGERPAGSARVINPGALYRARPRTFAVLDLATGALQSVVVE